MEQGRHDHLLSRPENRTVARFGRRRTGRDGDDARTVYELMRAHGSIAFARDGARQLAREAVRTFPEAFDHLPEGRDKRFLREIARYRMERRVGTRGAGEPSSR